MAGAAVPAKGEWPVDPQDAQPIDPERIWIDGCFDFFHHGHARVMLQARQLGNELYVGIHSDEEILEHKGPSVMNLKERVAASDACRWVTKVVPMSPYVTELPWVDHYGCQYVVHGDDITSDSGGEDTYRFVKQAGRMKIVKRTQGISTTDLVGRMLLCTKDHHIPALEACLSAEDGPGTAEERQARAAEMKERLLEYATDASGRAPGIPLYCVPQHQVASAAPAGKADLQTFTPQYNDVRPGQRVVYVDGGFDLFSSGHIEFLRSVNVKEEALAQQSGWYTPEKVKERIQAAGSDYGPAFVVAGIHGDLEINQRKGLNFPTMNIFERGLCLVQCKYVHGVVFNAPFEPTEKFLKTLPHMPSAVYHGPTSYMEMDKEPYADAKRLGIFMELEPHEFQDVDAGTIVRRITNKRVEFEERQRRKGMKAVVEAEALKAEQAREQEKLAK